jgi:hypothetical protein
LPVARRRVAAVAAAAALVLALAAFLIGRSGGEASSGTTAVGDLRLELPGGWARSATVPGIPGLQLSDTSAFSPEAKSPATTLVAGTSNGTGKTLLPASFERTLSHPPRTDDPVRLGDVEAYRYRNLRPSGFADPVTLFVVPTPDRVATIACVNRRATAACENVAASLSLADDDALSLHGREAYADAVNPALSRLSSDRSKGRRALAQAKSKRGQAAAAGDVGAAYATAAKALGKAPPGPAEQPTTDLLVRKARELDRDYDELGSAARKNRTAAYRAATKKIKADENAFARGLRDLRDLGYQLE